MPYANSQGVRIYYQVEGAGPPLVLQHGFTGSLEDWYDRGYVEQLKRDHRLVLMDARGHGRSDKPRNPEACKPELMAGDVLALLDEMGIAQAHFFGYSMGGRIGFYLAKQAPERCYSMIIGGMHPYSLEGGEDDPSLQALRKGMESFVAFREASGPMTPERRARLLQGDAAALAAVRLARLGDQGVEDALPRMTMPCLVFCGEADAFYSGAKECVQNLPNATWVSLPGLNHGQAFEGGDLVLPHVTRFLQAPSRGLKTAV